MNGQMEKEKQIDVFGNEYEVPRIQIDGEKATWEHDFQKWSDKMSQDGTTPLGKCGYGYMCDGCELDIKNPCVMALRYMCKHDNVKVDYSQRNDEYFEKVFNGEF